MKELTELKDNQVKYKKGEEWLVAEKNKNEPQAQVANGSEDEESESEEVGRGNQEKCENPLFDISEVERVGV